MSHLCFTRRLTRVDDVRDEVLLDDRYQRDTGGGRRTRRICLERHPSLKGARSIGHDGFLVMSPGFGWDVPSRVGWFASPNTRPLRWGGTVWWFRPA